MSGGQFCGGFAGYMLRKEGLSSHATLDNCSAAVTVTGSAHYAGGLVGYVEDGAISNCSATGNVASAGKNRVGGLVGQARTGSVTKCYATGNVNAAGYSAGLVGTVGNAPDESFTISKSYYSTGKVQTTSNQAGGLVGCHLGLESAQADGGSLTIDNCYVSGNVQANQRAGGLLGNHFSGSTSIEDCYIIGEVIASIDAGGIVGWVESNGLSVVRCMPFNAKVEATNSDGNQHYSSGIVIGYANKNNSPEVEVNMCYRKKSFSFSDCSGHSDNIVENHGFISPAAAIPKRKSTLTYSYYHHGRQTNSSTVSALVQRTDIGGAWSADIWDFSTDNPTLRP